MIKTFLGTGLLGSGFVKAMLKRGDNVHVWNRTTSKAQKLEPFGAKVSKDVSDAVADADRVHVCLRDDASVDDVLSKAGAGFKPGTTIIDHTTTSVKGAIERTTDWKAKGLTYLHAPVLMGPKNALESTGCMLVSGDQSVIQQLEPELSKMTGKVLNFGDTEGKAAGMKLIGNLFLIANAAGLSDALGLAKSLDFSTDDLQMLFSAWDAGSITGTLNKWASDDFKSPSWELTMARKDAGLMMGEADQNGTKLTTIPAIAKEMDRWIENGHAKDDWTVFVSDKIPK